MFCITLQGCAWTTNFQNIESGVTRNGVAIQDLHEQINQLTDRVAGASQHAQGISIFVEELTKTTAVLQSSLEEEQVEAGRLEIAMTNLQGRLSRIPDYRPFSLPTLLLRVNPRPHCQRLSPKSMS
jgi:hypothetical protein